VRVARQQGWPVSQRQFRQRVQWQQRQGRSARKRGLAGLVRAMAMARKTAMAKDDNNHVDGNDGNNGDNHNDNGVKDGNNNDDADNDNKDKDYENGDSNGDNDKDDGNGEQ
jgi:hypothetical protein